MNYSNYRFTLDIQSNISQVSLPVRLGDTGRRLYINLTDSGNPYTISKGSRAVFSGKKADGTPLLNDCIIEGDTTICYDFTAQTTNVAGIIDIEIRLYGPNGKLVTSPRFIMVVDERVVYNDDIPLSESELTTLDNIILLETQRQDAEASRVEAEEARAEASETAIANANTAADNALAVAELLEQKLEAGEFIGDQGDKGEDGVNGKDGYTPIKGIDYFDGKDGVNGKDGKDYVLTYTDKTEIANLVLAEFPIAEDISV